MELMIGFVLPIVLMVAIMYFLLIRPQKKQQQAHQQVVAALKVGDEIQTFGGICGSVVRVSDEHIALKTDASTILVRREAIAKIVSETIEETK